MGYLRINAGQPQEYAPERLRYDHPNVSFPLPMPDELLASYGVLPYVSDPPPAYDPLTATLRHGAFVDDGPGGWRREWIVEAMPQAQAEANVRARRDSLLASSDWRVMRAVETAARGNSPIQIPSDWADYRQALRDISAQPGFPYAVSWPTPPAA